MPDEKFDEKDREKREEKSPQEKSWDEKWRRDPLSAIIWALILIWAGLALVANNAGMIDDWGSSLARITGIREFNNLQVWNIILLGVAVLVFLEVIVRLLVPAYRRSVTGSLIFGLILLGIALGDIISWNILWPIILIIIGLSILLRGVFRKAT
jgi:hypothetical protein